MATVKQAKKDLRTGKRPFERALRIFSFGYAKNMKAFIRNAPESIFEIDTTIPQYSIIYCLPHKKETALQYITENGLTIKSMDEQLYINKNIKVAGFIA